MHTPSIIEAEEAEEIGVEHLLRDIRDVGAGTLATRITKQLQSLQGLHTRLRDISDYLKKVQDGKLPVNHAINDILQNVFNLLPNLSPPTPDGAGGSSSALPLRLKGAGPGALAAAAAGVGSGAAGVGGGGGSELAHAMSIKTNDQLMTIYLSSLIRAITAFHDLIENKNQNRQQQEEKDAKKDAEAGGDSATSKKGGAKDDGKKDGQGPVNGINGEPKEAAEKDKDKGGKDKKEKK